MQWPHEPGQSLKSTARRLLDSIDNTLYAISRVCCTDLTPCTASADGIPAECTFDCNRHYAPFIANCRETIAAMGVAEAEAILATIARDRDAAYARVGEETP